MSASATGPKTEKSEPFVVRTPDEAVALAKRFEKEGRFAESEQLYRKTLAKEPNHLGALRGLGILAHKAKRHADAADLLRKAVSIDPKNADLHNDLGGIYGELGRTEHAVAEFQEALKLRPDYAEVHGNLGTALQRLGKNEEAVETLKKATELKPDSPVVHTQLGAAMAKLERHEEAAAAFRTAIAIQPQHAEAYGRLGNSLRALGKHIESVAALKHAMQLKPNYPEAHVNLGLSYLEQNLAQDSVNAFATAIRLKPDYAEAHWNHGLALLLAGDWTRGWPEYEWRRPLRNDPIRRRNAPVPMWDGSDLGGKTILLHTEQGFGDTIMFVRYAGVLADRGAKVVVQVRPELVRLCASAPGVTQAIGPKEQPPHLDFHAHLMSLPAILGTTEETCPNQMPYLRPDDAQVNEWRSRLAGDTASLKVGIAWGCNPKPLPTRACPLINWLPLSGISGVSLYVLQKGEPAKQAADPPAGMVLKDLTFALNDFADTAALIANLDLVISVDTSVAHVAAALGKPTWVLLPWVSDWRWMLNRDDSPWYPTVRLFRQAIPGDWQAVLTQIAKELRSHPAISPSTLISGDVIEVPLHSRTLLRLWAEAEIRLENNPTDLEAIAEVAGLRRARLKLPDDLAAKKNRWLTAMREVEVSRLRLGTANLDQPLSTLVDNFMRSAHQLERL